MGLPMIREASSGLENYNTNMDKEQIKNWANGIAHSCQDSTNPLARIVFNANRLITAMFGSEQSTELLQALIKALEETFFTKP